MRRHICVLSLLVCGLKAQDSTFLATWSGTTPLNEARQNACAVRLADGQILVAGGIGVDGVPLASVEIYQADGTFASASPMFAPRTRHACVLLPSGQVLAIGGDGVGTAELYDPIGNTWQTVDGMGQPRSGSMATLLRDRRVLIAGGSAPDGTPLDSVEVFNLQEGTLTPLDATLTTPRDGLSAVLQNDGTVFFIGGSNADGVLPTIDVFSPVDDSIAPGPALNVGRTSHSATLLLDGRTLVAGGFDGNQELDTLELYDPATGAFQLLDAKLQTARRDHLALLVPGNGGVLIAGGRQGDQAQPATDLFQPVDGTIIPLGDLTLPRSGMAAAAISEGTILATGGVNSDGAQAACGVLLIPALQISKNLYRPSDLVQVSGANFRPNTKINFTLELISAGVPVLSNSRLLTPSVTAPSGGQFQIFTNFPPVSIMNVAGSDAGKTVLIIGQTADGTTVQTTAPVRVATSLAITQPTGLYTGLNGTFLALLSRGASAVPMTGLFILSASPANAGCLTPLTDGTSNTIIISEGPAAGSPNAVSANVNTTTTGALLSKSVSDVSLTPLKVIASYSGDTANDPASAQVCFQAVTRLPTLQLAGPISTLQAGSPFNLVALVTVHPGNPQPPLNGTVNFSLDGFPLGPAQSSVQTSSPPTVTATRSFTPLSVGALTFTAQYGGDSFFDDAASVAPLTLNVQKANTSLSMTSSQTTYHCDSTYTAHALLSFPPALGLSNTSVSLQSRNNDGSVRILPGSSATLSVVSPGVASATFNVPSVPSTTTSVQATFAGDQLLAGSLSAASFLTLATSSSSVQIVSPQGTQTNPVSLIVRVSPSGCSTVPTGNLEILDGGSPVTVVPVSGPVNIGASFVDVLVTLSRPAGSHSIQAIYSGDRVYQQSSSTPVTVVFQ